MSDFSKKVWLGPRCVLEQWKTDAERLEKLNAIIKREMEADGFDSKDFDLRKEIDSEPAPPKTAHEPI